MTEYTNPELLDMVLGGIAMKDMSAMTFLQWLSKKLDGVPTYQADTQELLAAVRSVPMTRNMPDDEKLRLVRKLLALDISL